MKRLITLVASAFSLLACPAVAAPKPAKPAAPAYVPPPAAPLPALNANGNPVMTVEEGLQNFETLGYRIAGGKAVNLCGRPATPKISFKDLNGDGFPEAIATETDKVCYGGPFVSIAWRQRNGVWAWLYRSRGEASWGATRTQGWLDMHIKTKCDVAYLYDGKTYQPNGSCAADQPTDGVYRPERLPVDFDQAFKAAGMVKKNGNWTGCADDDYGMADVANGDYRDINQDGVNDLIITDGGTACYGMTGSGFIIMTHDASGWKQFYSSPGIPTFLATPVKTPGGWPDVEVGGPGFCFPINRWNGKDYVFLKNHEYEKGACKRQGM